MYEWGDAKQRANVAKHGVDFVAITSFDWDTAMIAYDDRHAEPRFIATGFIGRRLHVAVFTERGDRVRVISLRRANSREARRYAAA